MKRIGNKVKKLPIKKQISLSKHVQEDSPKAAKRTKTCSAEWNNIDLLKIKRDLAFQRYLLDARLSNDTTHRPSKDSAISCIPKTITPNSIFTELKDSASFAMAPHPPFQGQRASNFVNLTKDEEMTNTKENPLDLLSSISTLLSQTSVQSFRGNPDDESIIVQDTAPEEIYRGQRHPETDLCEAQTSGRSSQGNRKSDQSILVQDTPPEEGMMKYLNGCQYVGFFVNDKREGYGKCYYPNGCVYTGYWKDGKRHGRGEIRYANGDRFDGEWKEDLRHGAGIYYWKDGTTDLCWYERQKIVGEGCRWSPDKEKMWALNNGEIVMLGPSTLQFHSEFKRVITRRLGF